MNIFLQGSIAFDEVSKFYGKFSDVIKPDLIHKLSVSFVVFEKEKFFGGCAGNIAYSMGLLKTKAYVCSPVGEDGDEYIKSMKNWGLDTEYVQKMKGHTALAFITTDSDQNQIAHFAPGVLATSEEFVLPEIAEKGDIILISPENHDRMIQAIHLSHEKQLRVFFDPGQLIHSFNKVELIDIFGKIDGLFVNEYEWELLKNISGMNKKEIVNLVKVIFITKGAEGVELIEDGISSQIEPYKIETAIDPTGAGDAFRAGVLSALKQNLYYKTAAKVGSIMGALSVEHKQCQGHKITPDAKQQLETLGFSL